MAGTPEEIVLEQVIASVATAVALEDYPATSKGPSVLALQRDGAGPPGSCRVGHPESGNGTRRTGDGLSARSKAVVRGFHETDETMTKRKAVELIREGKYAAEVAIELIDDEGSWSPTMSLDDAKKLDAVRLALKRGDVAAAAKHGRVFELTPVAAK